MEKGPASSTSLSPLAFGESSVFLLMNSDVQQHWKEQKTPITFLPFFLFLMKEQTMHYGSYSPVSCKLDPLTPNFSLGIPAQGGAHITILKQYPLCSPVIVRLSRAVSSWWKQLLRNVYKLWKALKASECISLFWSLNSTTLLRHSSACVQIGSTGSCLRQQMWQQPFFSLDLPLLQPISTA